MGVFSPKESAPIEQVEQRGGFTPVSALAGIGQATKILADEVVDQRKRQLTEQIKGETKDIGDFLRLSRNPALINSEFGVEAVENPVVRATLAEFVRVRNASEQGLLPQAFAMERLRAIQNSAIAEAPEFEQEIRQAMVSATGQDPQRQFFHQLLSTQAQKQTPEQKARDEITKQAAIHGVTPDEYQQIMFGKLQAEAVNNRVAIRKGNGTLSLFDLQQDVQARTGNIMLDIMGEARKVVTTKGGLGPEDTQRLKLLVGQSIAAASAKVQAGAKDVTGADMVAALAPLETMQENINGMIDDGSLQKLVTSRNALKTSIIEGNVMNLDKYAVAWALGGQQGFGNLVKWIEDMSNEGQEKLLGALSPKVGAQQTLNAAGLNGRSAADIVVDQYGKMGTGETPGNQVEANARAHAAGVALATPNGSETLYATALQELRDLGGDLAWSAVGSKQVINTATKSPTVRAAVIQLHTTTTAGLADEYLGLTQNTGVDTRRFKFVDGQLDYTFDRAELKGVNAEATAEAKAFAARFNRANRISAAHSATGTLSENRYTGTQNYWELITSAGRQSMEGLEQEQDDTPQVVKWGRDANGRPIKLK